MEAGQQNNSSKLKAFIWSESFLIIVLIGLSIYLFISLKDTIGNSEKQIQNIEKQLAIANEEISRTKDENYNLANTLYAEQQKNSEFENQINEIAGTVGILEKLSKTDPELLQKYSKVFFLNEHYQPANLTKIAEEFLKNPEKEVYVHKDVSSYLKRLMERAENDGLNLQILSAFRSFGDQTSLKSNYVFTYGAGTANQFSADQGYSEHQLGTTVDFTTPTLGDTLIGFQNTPEYEWLTENAYRYGFTLSYPPNNSYYQYEPWHWRFVGQDLARYLDRENIYFYGLDQRTINEYLISIFD